eukprot:2258865-Rhodomonas_salina.4
MKSYAGSAATYGGNAGIYGGDADAKGDISGAMLLSAILLFIAACSSCLLPDLSNTSLDDAPAS